MGRTRQILVSDCLCEFAQSDSHRRHLAKVICKPEDEENESTEEPEDETEEESDDTKTEDEIPEPESTMSKSEPWDRIMK